MFLKWGEVGGKGDTVQKRRPSARTAGGERGGGQMILSLRECRRQTQLRSGRASVRREETGLVTGLLGEGRFMVTSLTATTLSILMAFPWKSACLWPIDTGKYTLAWAEVRMTFLWSFRKLCVRTESFA